MSLLDLFQKVFKAFNKRASGGLIDPMMRAIRGTYDISTSITSHMGSAGIGHVKVGAQYQL